MWVMLTICKVFTILFLLCLWGYEKLWQLSKSAQINKLFFEISVQLCYCLDQIEVGRKVFWKVLGGNPAWYYPRPPGVLGCYKTKKIPLIFYIFDPLTNNYSRGWSSMINFVSNRFQDVLKKSCQHGEGQIIAYGFQEKDVSRIRDCHIEHPLLESSSHGKVP